MKRKVRRVKRFLALALSVCMIMGGLGLNCLTAMASEGTNVFVRIENDTVYFQTALNKTGGVIAAGTEIKDSLSKGMSFDKENAKLLVGKITEDGIVATNEDLGIGTGYSIDYSISTDGCETMTIKFLKETSVVAVLDYSVRLTDKKNISSYKNELVEPLEDGNSTTTITFSTKTYVENVEDYEIVPAGTEGAVKLYETEGKAVVKLTGTKLIVDKEAWDEEIEIPAQTRQETKTVTDKEAWTEEIHHPAETHEETRTVVDKEEWIETIHHPAETKTVENEVVVKEAWTE